MKVQPSPVPFTLISAMSRLDTNRHFGKNAPGSQS
jgi:hypothetical protein